MGRSIQSATVLNQLESIPEPTRTCLLKLRNLILETATSLVEVGEIEETLKWGQPSYLPARPRIGTTVRIDQVRGEPRQYAIYVHCQTNLIETIRERYPGQLTTDGTRAIIFDADEPLPVDVIEEFVTMAFTYHLR